jgi:D-glycero-alpha-D-manno-heptose-7-phosphate kinase
MMEMVDEGVRVLTEGKDILEFGRLLDEAWKLKRSLTDKISTPEIDEIYETARKAGAIGGKLLGAGGGGFILLFVKPEEQANLREKLKKLLEVPFKFENSGSEVIFNKPYSFKIGWGTPLKQQI